MSKLDYVTIRDLLAEIARLRRDRDAAQASLRNAMKVIEPFAKRAKDIGQPDYGMPILRDHHRVDVTLGACRAAVAFLDALASSGAAREEEGK